MWMASFQIVLINQMGLTTICLPVELAVQSNDSGYKITGLCDAVDVQNTNMVCVGDGGRQGRFK